MCLVDPVSMSNLQNPLKLRSHLLPCTGCLPSWVMDYVSQEIFHPVDIMAAVMFPSPRPFETETWGDTDTVTPAPDISSQNQAGDGTLPFNSTLKQPKFKSTK